MNFGIMNHEFVILSNGDYPGIHLKREAVNKKTRIPNYLSRWVNIKKVFPDPELFVFPEKISTGTFSNYHHKW